MVKQRIMAMRTSFYRYASLRKSRHVSFQIRRTVFQSVINRAVLIGCEPTFLFIIASAAHGHLLCAVLGGKYHQFEPEASKSQGAGYLNQDLIFQTKAGLSLGFTISVGTMVSALSSVPSQPASPAFLVVLCRVHLPCIWCSFPDLQEDMWASAVLVHELLHEHDGTRRGYVVLERSQTLDWRRCG